MFACDRVGCHGTKNLWRLIARMYMFQCVIPDGLHGLQPKFKQDSHRSGQQSRLLSVMSLYTMLLNGDT